MDVAVGTSSPSPAAHWDDVADEVLAIIRFFRIEDLVGFCTLDNEAKNATTVVVLGRHLGFDGIERMIRCAPHALQLAIRALLYGDGCKRLPLDRALATWGIQAFSDEDEESEALERAFDDLRADSTAFDDQQSFFDDSSADQSAIDSSSDSGDEEDEEADVLSDARIESILSALDYEPAPQVNSKALEKYYKSGPLGKLHNHGICFHRSSQLVSAFHNAQRAVNKDAPVREWVHNNATRWQSDEAMAARAIEQRAAITTLHQILEYQWELAGAKVQDRPPLLDFKLGPQDWMVVGVLQKILTPFRVASRQLQGNGPKGALDQYLPQIEYLLLHLEDCARNDCYLERDDPDNPTGPRLQEVIKIFDGLDPQRRRFLKAYIRVGLWKLQQYYDKLTNLAYAAAVVFNPSLKMAGLQGIFDAEPPRQERGWRDHYTNRLRKEWEDNYKNK